MVLYEVRNSRIHGKGVYAKTNVKKGTSIIQYKGEKISKEESYKRTLKLSENPSGPQVYVFELDQNHDLDGDIPSNDAKYINHSCDPNCEAVNYGGEIFIDTIKDIKSGEEITFNYNYGSDVASEHPCRCGSKNCVGYIVCPEEKEKLINILDSR